MASSVPLYWAAFCVKAAHGSGVDARWPTPKQAPQ